jgi:prepilin peptidase CpaA
LDLCPAGPNFGLAGFLNPIESRPCDHTEMTYADDIFRTAIVLVLIVFLTTAVATDLKKHRIPNLLLWPALSLALMMHMTSGGIDGLIVVAGGMTLGFAMLLPLYSIGGMGAGDVKLLSVVGGLLGPWGALVAGVATMIAGALFGIAFILWRCIWPRIQFSEVQALGPLGKQTGSVLSLRSTKGRKPVAYIPYAPAIAAGTMAALWYIDFVPQNFLGHLV